MEKIKEGDLPCNSYKCPFGITPNIWDCQDCGMKVCDGDCENCKTNCMAKINTGG